MLEVLDRHERELTQLVKNTGVVFGALNERQGELRQLIVNSNNVFDATASRDEALAETFRIFPTFLDESRATLARLEDFSRGHPPAGARSQARGRATSARPSRDLGELAPHLERLFRDLPALISSGNRNLPKAVRILQGAEPVFEALHLFLPGAEPDHLVRQLGAGDPRGLPHQRRRGDLDHRERPRASDCPAHLRSLGVINARSFDAVHETRPPHERGNAYLAAERPDLAGPAARRDPDLPTPRPAGGTPGSGPDTGIGSRSADATPGRRRAWSQPLASTTASFYPRSRRARRPTVGAEARPRRTRAAATLPRYPRAQRASAAVDAVRLRMALPAGWARRTSGSTWSSRSSPALTDHARHGRPVLALRGGRPGASSAAC